MAEWLRRWTANPLGSARVGSNPILVVGFVTLYHVEGMHVSHVCANKGAVLSRDRRTAGLLLPCTDYTKGEGNSKARHPIYHDHDIAQIIWSHNDIVMSRLLVAMVTSL